MQFLKRFLHNVHVQQNHDFYRITPSQNAENTEWQFCVFIRLSHLRTAAKHTNLRSPPPPTLLYCSHTVSNFMATFKSGRSWQLGR